MRLAAQRRELILAAVREHGVVRLADLVDRLGVTAVTVRRDVTALADRGLVARVHGGITVPRHGEQPRPAPVAHVLVGMVAPSAEYYWPAVIQGAQAAVAAAGGRLALRASRYDAAEDRRQVAALLDRGVQALLVAPSTGGQAGLDLMRRLGGLSVPVVLIERVPPPELPTIGLDAAVTDHALGAGLAVRHLAALGHRAVGLVVSRPSPHHDAIRAGWRSAVASLDLSPDVPALDVPTYGSAQWAAVCDDVLDRCARSGVRALLVHADREAIGLVDRARDRGLDVPGELAVVSYDDEVAAASDPPLTAVRPRKHRLGALAAQLALARVADPLDRPVHRVSLWPSLVVRESCGAGSRRTPQ
ncbi:substrate-binding domain-containing protein [Saccharothrix longispora]|uniref:substrate-binding domain-containing protein n=1 Tax=Saccharothrix longispora TaxID=33920 RepID=UPI0028FD6A5C|nr:substrate-binding domain-containing protein [Saccharothrix longispora]MBY8849013.1 substrate-binding domain-containing protein [Saccharothrix sp. MB29]MDU0288016.1 substrate-binding domain-containing protein [Saccharothrix longispora]